jgi:hypothetical protein
MKIAESLILKSAEQEAEMYADLFLEIHPNIKVEEQKTKQAWLDGFESGKQFEKKKEMERSRIINSINNFQNNHNITAVGNLATGEGYYKNIFEKKQQ